MERARGNAALQGREVPKKEAVMVMEATQSKERIKVAIPCQKAGILAMEAHGLNDRCPLYGMFSQCVGELGGAFGSVVINCGGQGCPRGAISPVTGGPHHVDRRGRGGVGGLCDARAYPHLREQVRRI